jgi:GntR family transcriptional regulator, trigonelline degradation regulator
MTKRPEGGNVSDLSGRVERVDAPLRRQVFEVLREEIMEARLRPGQRLVERELTERIGVSRTTVREAIRELAAYGLVTTIPHKGAIVSVPSLQEAAELYDVRALLEGAAARQFAERASPTQVAALRKAFRACERSAKSEDLRLMVQAKDRFYGVLIEGAGNQTIRGILDGLRARVAALRTTTLDAPGRPQQSVEEIRAIVEAIEARDGEAAAGAASNHVRQAARVLFRTYARSIPAAEGLVS